MKLLFDLLGLDMEASNRPYGSLWIWADPAHWQSAEVLRLFSLREPYRNPTGSNLQNIWDETLTIIDKNKANYHTTFIKDVRLRLFEFTRGE